MSTPQGPQDPQQPGYGYGYPPPQQGYPPQSHQQGYPPQSPQQGYPPRSPQQPPPWAPAFGQPDWSALAEEQEARSRRKKRLVITGSVVGGAALIAAVVLVAANVATGKKNDNPGTDVVAQQSGGVTPSASPSSSGTASGSPAPTMRGSDMFTATKLPVNGRDFVRKTTSHESPCWKASESGLGPVLNKNHCSDVALATYTSGTATVTAGVMAFPSAADAEAAAAAFTGRLRPLTGKSGIPDFCGKVSCAVTRAVHGRYLYSTVAGPNSGAAGDKDSDAVAAGQGLAAYTLSRLIELD
jgi:hypothetical protein